MLRSSRGLKQSGNCQALRAHRESRGSSGQKIFAISERFGLFPTYIRYESQIVMPRAVGLPWRLSYAQHFVIQLIRHVLRAPKFEPADWPAVRSEKIRVKYGR
jgi:hypothetical protein